MATAKLMNCFWKGDTMEDVTQEDEECFAEVAAVTHAALAGKGEA
jgi:hypothetical protein